MATVFSKQSDSFYAAFYEPDPVKRWATLDAWIETTTPVVQAAIAEELKSLVGFVCAGRWTEEGWKSGAAKLRRIQGQYHLVMDIRLRTLGPRETFKGELPLTPVCAPAAPSTSSRNTSDESDDCSEDGGRIPNDDRSDALNPNNPAHQASMDNRSDQLNPNNPAYWSSRGR